MYVFIIYQTKDDKKSDLSDSELKELYNSANAHMDNKTTYNP